ncbi:hypothetical protein ACNQFZ_19490 [Schinkia sp. CFF1]
MVNSNWKSETAERIENVLFSMKEKEAQKYKVGILARVVQRLHQFSQDGCTECESLKENINEMLLFLEQKNEIGVKQYKLIFRTTSKHLVKKHALVEEGYYLSLCAGYGLLFGAVLSTLYDFAIAFGILIGIVVGLKLDEKAKKEDKVI